ncbi:MAG: hypothetical protein JWP87_340 [Labilithrix sp.]|jgi:hypothetical protein|nr:hypothetical protein [Labilithrix sp.]
MRKILGARVAFFMASVAALGVWVACGGSDDQEVLDSDAGAETSTVDRAPPVDAAPPDANKDTGVQETGPIYDAGVPNLIDGGNEFEGGIPCVVGGDPELEPNDDRLLANELKPTRCGAVLVSDGGLDGGESDFLTFTLADASTNFFIQYAGDVRVKVETDGQAPVDITEPDASLVTKKNQPYFVEVRSKTGKSQVWRVTLFQSPP